MREGKGESQNDSQVSSLGNGMIGGATPWNGDRESRFGGKVRSWVLNKKKKKKKLSFKSSVISRSDGVWGPSLKEKSFQFIHSVVSDSLQPHGLQHARLPCPSPTPGAYSNSCPSSRWCHPAISSSVIPFSSCLQSFPASGYFQMSQFFASGGQILEFQL